MSDFFLTPPSSTNSAPARAPRLRAHHNLHDSPEAPAHRMLVAMEPGSYVRPHRHLDPNKAETIIVLRGRLGVLVFDDEGGCRRPAR
jgi:cupin fold WbuC family metalloprotein